VHGMIYLPQPLKESLGVYCFVSCVTESCKDGCAMLNSEQSVKECDATMFNSNSTAWYKKNLHVYLYKILMLVVP
jgi:hypothetical protein